MITLIQNTHRPHVFILTILSTLNILYLAMVAYSDLPALVTAKILAFASSGIGSDITIWKQALPLLSVCHDWRVYGKYYLYRYAIVEHVDNSLAKSLDSESRSFSGNCIGDAIALEGRNSILIYTNITLIKKLGLESMVKQLLFDEKCHHVRVNEADSLKTFMSILEALFCGLPEEIRLTKPFIMWFELEYIDETPDSLLMRQCHDASKAVADALINRYPNVSSISTTMLYPHEFFQKLIVELVVGYDKQLTKYVNDMPTAFPYTLTAPKLVELDLTFYCVSEYDLPTICPRSPRKIRIDLDQIPFSWDMFRVGNVSETIVFDNLVDLSITDVYEDSDAGNMAIANNLDLEFPKLERLHTNNSSLTRKVAQAMMSHGLKWLHCEGSIISASQLCKQPLGTLDTLILVWVGEVYSEEFDDFVPLTNEIFNKTSGIEFVRCEISKINISEIMDRVDWPYLTHLMLGFNIPFNVLLDMLPKVPNLVHLEIDICGCDKNVLDETTELLTNIKEHYPIPSSSKIETLCLNISHSIMRWKFCNKMSFGGVFENLKWYLPQLKTIDILE